MKQNKLVDELRAQRELIQKHLEWLNQKISTLESDEGGKKTSAAEDSSKPEQTPKSTELEDTTKANQSANGVGAQNEDKELDFGRYKAPPGNDLQRAKLGCLVLFLLSTLLFLFLLFGLPYLMD